MLNVSDVDGPGEAEADGPGEAEADGPGEAEADGPGEAEADGPGEAEADGPGEAEADGPGEAEAVADSNVGVDFIDIIFGIAVGVVFMRFAETTRHQHDQWGYLVVALALIGFSWIGYHTAKTANPNKSGLRFTDFPTILQFFIDIAIVALYFAIATETNGRFSVEVALISIVFALYSMWDSLDMVINVPKSRQRLQNSLIFTVGFTAIAAFFEWPVKLHQTGVIIVLDAVVIVLLYVYRILQEGHVRHGR